MLYSYAGPMASRPANASDLPHPSEKDLDAFFSMMGQCIAAWAQVELALTDIYASTFTIHNHASARLAFIVPTGFRTRLDMVDASILILDLDDEVKKEWDKIKERCRKKSLSRNHLAHGQVLCMCPQVELVIASSVADPRKDFINKPLNTKLLKM